MAYSRIVKVEDIAQAVNYICKPHKTVSNGANLVYTHGYEVEIAKRQFKHYQKQKRRLKHGHLSGKGLMVYQDFEKNGMSPKTAHETGKKFAKTHLGKDHEYIVVTHTNTKKIHNHIIAKKSSEFNA